ncbi:MAG: FAD-binding protein [Flavobacteriales bacterium]|nr:FAD-binding protein [Flavobacteriales bacterium]
MVREIDLALGPNDAFDAEKRIREAAQQLGVEPDQINDLVVLRRSIDARKKDVLYRIKCAAYIDQIAEQPHFRIPEFPSVQDGKRIIIVGTGPAGLFAALKLIENGIKPILLERGKDVSTRRKDLHKLHIEHLVNPDSNYCFGEGGAGTYSDGKLYTRSKKRGDLQAVLNTLVNFGSSEDILIDAHPHIGTNKLPKIISRMRESILEAGGEVHFDTRVVDLGIDSSGIRSVTDQLGNVFESEAVILATGHSARDIFELVYAKGLSLEAKAFAMGVRIEHPQPLIDSIQYHCGTRRDKNLPAAAYSVVQQVNERGVFSFCMCPGGFIVPAATAPGEIVVNGMSTSTRDSRYANSGMVVAINLEDLGFYKSHGVFAGLEYQKALEKTAWEMGGKTQTAPAQRMVDFANGRVSAQLNDCSYIPGITSSPMHEWLPKPIRSRLQQGLMAFGKKMRGYYTNEAQILGVESRTSSPIKIPRNNDSLEHPECNGLFPCGEGGGYAGGIVSAAMDGERVAMAVVAKIKK